MIVTNTKIHWHINLCEYQHVPTNTTYTDAIQDAQDTNLHYPLYKPRDLDAANEKYRQRCGHTQKIQAKKLAEPPRLVAWRGWSRERPCDAQALLSSVSDAQAQPSGSGRGTHLYLPEKKTPVGDGLHGC